jgi:hypothetical protein
MDERENLEAPEVITEDNPGEDNSAEVEALDDDQLLALATGKITEMPAPKAEKSTAKPAQGQADNDLSVLIDEAIAKPADKAPPAGAQGDGDPAKQSEQSKAQDDNPPPSTYYKSQAEVDQAMGRVKATARKKALESVSPDLEIAKLVKSAYPGATPEEIKAAIKQIRDERLGYSPEQAAAHDNLQAQIDEMKSAQVEEPDDGDEGAPPVDTNAGALRPAQEVATELRQWADTTGKRLAETDPDFNIPAFFKANPSLLEDYAAGRTTMDRIYVEHRVPQLMAARKAQDTKPAQRARNAEVPDVIRTGSRAAGEVRSLNFEEMSDAEFEKADREIMRRVQSGGKVTFRE